MNKKAFSFVELIIVVSILMLLSIVAYSINNGVKQNTINTRVTADLETIKTSLMQYKSENGVLPLPDGNLNNFQADGSYSHDGINIVDTKAFGTFGKITEQTLPNKYLNSDINDPRTNNYYSYGITKDKQLFEIAGVIAEEDNFIAKVTGTYRGEGGPKSLVRAYNSAFFVTDAGGELPYNPYEKTVNVTVRDVSNNILGVYSAADNKSIGPFGEDTHLYFSDGSMSLLTSGSQITLKRSEYLEDNGLITKIELTLNAGTLWTKATRLLGGGADPTTDSEFEIQYNSDTTAAVRGTIFCVSDANACGGGMVIGDLQVGVAEGLVQVQAPNLGGSGIKRLGGDSKINPPVIFQDENQETVYENKIEGENIPTQQEVEAKTDSVIQEEAAAEIKKLNPTNIDTSECIKIPSNNCLIETKEIGGENYKLIAYAPYNRPGAIDMYTTNIAGGSNKITPWSEEVVNLKWGIRRYFQKGMLEDIGCRNANGRHSFCHDNDKRGLFLDNEHDPDYLKYFLVDGGGNNILFNPGDDFAIEMKVRGLNRKTGKYYLFNGYKDSVNVSAYIKDGYIQIQSKKCNDWSTTCANMIGGQESSGNLNITESDTSLYTITIHVKNKTLTVYKNGEPIQMSINKFEENPEIDYLWVGNRDSGSQWNNIISYVKIYK